MSAQLSFAWPVHVALGAEDFFVSAANAPAYAMIGNDDTWPDGKLALIGPHGSGKSHLARIWQAATDALILPAATLDPAAPLPKARAVIVEDLEHLPPASEEYLFHLHNHLRSTGGRLLLTARSAPTRWTIRLPDLASRMQGTSVIRIDDPDDTLLAAVIMKHFADRQLAPPPDLAAYLAARIERSFAAAGAAVARLDSAAMAENRQITRGFARAVLGPLLWPDALDKPKPKPDSDGLPVS